MIREENEVAEDLRRRHCEAITSGQLASVRAFVEAHPMLLNEVRFGIRQRRKGREEKEKRRRRRTHHDGDAFSL